MNLQETFDQYTDDDFIAAVEDNLKKLGLSNPDFNYSGADPNGPTGKLKAGCQYNAGPTQSENPDDPLCHKSLPIEGKESSGCIFGQTFQAMGWDGKFTDNEEMEFSGSPIGPLCSRLGKLNQRSDIQDKWASIQARQDKGHVWGEVIKGLYPLKIERGN